MPATPKTILALDVGEVRIGLAIARAETRFPVPLMTLANDEAFFAELQKVASQESVNQLVVGLPRGLEGQDTEQTSYVRRFAADIEQAMKLPVAFQDEALTSQKAEQELQGRKKMYTKEDVDALSATYILEDYLGGAA